MLLHSGVATTRATTSGGIGPCNRSNAPQLPGVLGLHKGSFRPARTFRAPPISRAFPSPALLYGPTSCLLLEKRRALPLFLAPPQALLAPRI